MKDIDFPDLQWYIFESKEKGMLPRCPFASAYRCPRYYQSISLLGKAGGTAIDQEEDKRLLERWNTSDLWPIVDEQATSISGSDNRYDIYSKFCPEVLFDRFGWFATFMAEYADEIDRDTAHKQLGSFARKEGDWRWAWAHVTPMHYSVCPLYAPLTVGIFEKGTQRQIGFK